MLRAAGVLVALSAGLVLAAPAKKAPAAAPGTPAAAGKTAPADLPERVIEKKDGDYVLRLTIRPGNLKVNHVAEAEVEISRTLDVPDPVTGDQMPITSTRPVATVTPPETGRGKHEAPPAPSRFVVWPASNPGSYGFHFTPDVDGLYEVTISGMDSTKTDDNSEPQAYSASWHIGAGTAASETEQSQGGAAVRQSTRRPVGTGSGGEKERKLDKLMADIADRYLNLEMMIGKGTPKGGPAEMVLEARAIAGLLDQTKGLTPDAFSDGSAEFDQLTAKASAALAEVANAAGGKDHAKLVRAFDAVESVGCNECHAKYRFQVTDDVSNWPKFTQKAVSP